MNVYHFEISDVLTGKDVLYSSIYIEVEVNKFGNNVVSCLMNYFKEFHV